MQKEYETFDRFSDLGTFGEMFDIDMKICNSGLQNIIKSCNRFALKILNGVVNVSWNCDFLIEYVLKFIWVKKTFVFGGYKGFYKNYADICHFLQGIFRKYPP